MAFSSEVLTLEVDGHVATLWLDRPDARNAMGRALFTDLPLAAKEVAANSDIRVLVIAAKGPAFTVGLDLKTMGGNLGASSNAKSSAVANSNFYDSILRMQDANTCFAELKIPVIAAVHGYCLGGGIDLITACDIRLCSSDTVFSVREAKIAIVADLGTLQRLPKIVSAGHVAELAYSAKDFDAAHAERIGLVNRVAGANAESVLAAAYELANEIAANSPLAVQGTKAVLNANDGRTIDEGLKFVANWNALYINSNDLKEAFTAFIERRPAVFNGD
ncbi:MAG: crotonase/enoyl-CoA hydratase family protein [Acidimicrobiaceae bacterium]|jgi:enoyl-CoA hydratase